MAALSEAEVARRVDAIRKGKKEGKTLRQIARELGVSAKSIEWTRRRFASDLEFNGRSRTTPQIKTTLRAINSHIDASLEKGGTKIAGMQAAASDLGMTITAVRGFLRRHGDVEPRGRKPRTPIVPKEQPETKMPEMPEMPEHPAWTPDADAALFEAKGKYDQLADLAKRLRKPMIAIEQRWHLMRSKMPAESLL